MFFHGFLTYYIFSCSLYLYVDGRSIVGAELAVPAATWPSSYKPRVCQQWYGFEAWSAEVGTNRTQDRVQKCRLWHGDAQCWLSNIILISNNSFLPSGLLLPIPNLLNLNIEVMLYWSNIYTFSQPEKKTHWPFLYTVVCFLVKPTIRTYETNNS